MEKELRRIILENEGDRDDIYADVVRLLKRGNWISVKDQLPVDEGKVLLYGEPFFGESTPEMETGLYYDEESGKFLFWINDREVKGFGVTHWMPLPAPPTE